MADILGGLMAGANFGTGFIQGKQQAVDRANTNKMNDLAIQDYQLKVDQDKLAVQQQQALSDRAMQLFNPMSTPGGQPTPQANMPGTDKPMDISAQTGEQQDPSDRMEQLANFAAGSGDLTHANQLWTNAANLRNAKFEQQQKKAAVETGELKRQQMHYGLVSQYAASLPDSPEGFAQLKMAVLSDPNSSEEERRNFGNMNYRPGIMQQIQDSGMTASQRASQRLKDQEFSEKQRVNDLQEAHRQRQDAEKVAHDRATEQAKQVNTKVGAIAKAPDEKEIASATQATKEAMGEGADTNSDDFKRARLAIANRANQIVRNNRAVTYDQAVQMAAMEAKNNGEIGTATTADTHARIFGMNIPGTGEGPKTTATFTPKGNTPETGIELKQGMKESELVQGKYYTYGGKTYQAIDGKLHPVQ